MSELEPFDPGPGIEPVAGRGPAAKPRHSRYGRPADRSKRPYKNKGIPRALHKADTELTKSKRAADKRQTETISVLAKRFKVTMQSNNALERLRVVRVLVAGASPHDVAKRLNLDISYCSNLLKQTENEMQTIGKEEFSSLITQRVMAIIQGHQAIGGRLELLSLEIERDFDKVLGLIAGIELRQAQHQAQEPAPGDAHNVLRATWRATGKALATELKELQAFKLTLNQEHLAIEREQRANNKDFIDTVTKMGVTTSAPAPKNGTPTPVPAPNNFSGSGFYAGMTQEYALQRLEEAARDMGRYLKEKRKILQVIETEVKVIGSPEEVDV